MTCMTTPSTSEFAPVEPVEHKPRNIVLSFDDVPNPSQTNASNVYKLLLLLHNDEDHSQVVYYDSGVGTRIKPGFWSDMISHSILLRVGKILDNAFALYIHQHVIDCYDFLVRYYNPGDRLFFFGFARGAYFARVVAAMLHKVGLVMRNEVENERIQATITLAYDLYVSTRPDNEAVATFKNQYCHPVSIDFFGVWDTAPSVGLLRSRTLPFVDGASMRVFRQALSLDEHRSRFRPNLFRPNILNESLELQDMDETFETDVREVWFAGTLSDVGGGSVPDTALHDLANISLRWMIEQLVLSRCQIKFRYENFALYKVPTTIGQDRSEGSPSASEDVNALNAQDALQPITDKLKSPLWWILEVIPTSYAFQNMEGKWVTTFRPHLGRGRQLIPGALFHTSVKMRMDDPNLMYKPRASYENGTEVYVS